MPQAARAFLELGESARTVPRAARETTTDGALVEAPFVALQAELGNEQVVDLTLAVGFYNAVVRVLGTLQIDVEPDYLGYLQKYPFPA